MYLDVHNDQCLFEIKMYVDYPPKAKVVFVVISNAVNTHVPVNLLHVTCTLVIVNTFYQQLIQLLHIHKKIILLIKWLI